MSFQGSINNLLSTAAVAGRFAPGAEARQEAHRAKKQLKALNKQQAQIAKSAKSGDIAEGSTEHQIYQDIQEQKTETAQTLFAAKPSAKNFRRYRQARWDAGDPFMTVKATPEEILQERADMEAEAALQREGERLQRTREALMANTPTPMTGRKGGTITYDNV